MTIQMPRLALAFLAALAVAPSLAVGAEIEADSAVGRVIVYPDRARVTRTATVQVAKGSHEILVAGLPPGIDVDTLRAEGEGSARVVLGSLDVRLAHGAEQRGERARRLMEQILSLEDADRELADADEAARFEMDYVRQLQQKATTELGQETLARDGRAQEAEQLVEALGRRYRQAQAETRRVRVERRDLARQIEATRAEHAQITSGADRNDFRVSVAVEVKSAGSFTLHLTYAAPGASWAPSYDARLYPDVSQVEMTCGAWVRQGTGEDWTSVDLLLSTAQPALGLQAPELYPWILQQSPPEPRPSPSSRSRAAKSEAPMSADYDDWAAAEAEAPMEEVYEAEVIQAEAAAVGSSIEFAIPGKVSVPGDGTRKRVTIATWTYDKAAVSYLATPATSSYVFQWATIVNDRDWPLLPGELQAFMTDRYVGRSAIGKVAPGEELRLPFGVEDRLSVKRDLVSHGSGPKGAFGGKTSIEWQYRFDLQSFLQRPVVVELRDRIPVSEYARYTVKLYEDSTPHARERDRGILVWMVDLAAGAKADVVLKYAVAFPADEQPWGL